MPRAAGANNQAVQIAVMATQLSNMAKDVHEMKEEMKGKYVTQEEIKVLKAVVYGFVGSVLLGFAGAVTAFFIRVPQ